MGSECIGCNLVNIAPITLTDGRTVCSSCPDYRLQCEAKDVLGKPLEARKAYLAGVEAKRGKAGADLLKAAITAEWERTK